MEKLLALLQFWRSLSVGLPDGKFCDPLADVSYLCSLKDYLLSRHECNLIAGPKELPIMARTAGRLTGQAAAFISRSRAQWQKFAEDTEITQARPLKMFGWELA